MLQCSVFQASLLVYKFNKGIILNIVNLFLNLGSTATSQVDGVGIEVPHFASSV